MSNPTPDPTSRAVRPVEGVGAGTPKAPRSEPQGPAFKVLLERLETQARELEQKSKNVEAASDLADAVGDAQESLTAALSFSDRILEAYRQALRQEPAAPANDPAGDDAVEP